MLIQTIEVSANSAMCYSMVTPIAWSQTFSQFCGNNFFSMTKIRDKKFFWNLLLVLNYAALLKHCLLIISYFIPICLSRVHSMKYCSRTRYTVYRVQLRIYPDLLFTNDLVQTIRSGNYDQSKSWLNKWRPSAVGPINLLRKMKQNQMSNSRDLKHFVATTKKNRNKLGLSRAELSSSWDWTLV